MFSYLLQLKCGADYRASNNAGLQCANIAAYSGSTDILRFLFETMDNFHLEQFVQQLDCEGNTILHAAVDSGNLETLQFCLQHFAEIDAAGQDLCTPVHSAAMTGQLAMLQTMFLEQPERKRVALALKDISGMTALHKSVLYDKETVADFLIAQGAELEAQDATYKTPLLLAASKRSFKCVRLLINRGANFNAVDKDGRNIVHLVVIYCNSIDALFDDELLLLVSLSLLISVTFHFLNLNHR